MTILTALMTTKIIETAMAIIITIVMAILAYTDGKYRKIPNRIMLAAAGLWLVLTATVLLTNRAVGLEVAVEGVTGALIAGVAFLLVYIITRGKLGAGDVKMAALMGLYLGSDRIGTTLIIGIVISAVYSIIMIIAKKLTVKDGLPMAPFLFLGTIIALLYTIMYHGT